MYAMHILYHIPSHASINTYSLKDPAKPSHRRREVLSSVSEAMAPKKRPAAAKVRRYDYTRYDQEYVLIILCSVSYYYKFLSLLFSLSCFQ